MTNKRALTTAILTAAAIALAAPAFAQSAGSTGASAGHSNGGGNDSGAAGGRGGGGSDSGAGNGRNDERVHAPVVTHVVPGGPNDRRPRKPRRYLSESCRDQHAYQNAFFNFYRAGDGYLYFCRID